MDFYIYNTLTREKEKFIPVEEGKVRLYTCGPTVYNFAHIGNLRTYIFEDVLKKSLEYIGYKVKHVMNITDVGHLESNGDSGEDKMAKGAEREHKTVWEIARFYEEAFLNDCKRLNIESPTVKCRATEHIQDMINFIKILEEKGYTYISNGNVYFSIEKFPDYNKLANLSMEDLKAGSRIEIDNNKQNPMDFVLWFTNSKFSNQIMQWESPWGKGFPGWHIECSAMSMKYLGDKIDIHCGGIDHIPVHHTNEIAQSEAAIGHKWVDYWVHGEFLLDNDGKMSKSSGEFLTVDRLIENGFSALDYRYFCIQSKYRKQLVFNFDNLREAQNSFKKLKSKILNIASADKKENINDENIKKYKDAFIAEITNDINIANAITVLNDVIKDDFLNNSEKIVLINDFDKVLSLDLTKPVEKKADGEEVKWIEELIEARNAARKSKDWAKADEIRKELLEKGIEIKDTREGTQWKHV
ncbi:cysteine--tRNA ligase [Clostridium sp. 19966]|uniref:cysteine--tRNA ligase n=1 Tax=Clostridium sp. 19966 TaxID=2768166 RepID=UPI0028E0056F|nr:cysteine--tRNA ligase [Clostridium sp. 19966]MDT8718958.1 cysteine--tRNA ligase [Clostridium sp. 19966]